MMALDSTLIIIMLEILVLLIVLVISLLFISKRKRSKELNAIHSFIDELEKEITVNNKPLERLLSDSCGLDPQEAEATLKNINASERALLQNVIQLFLQREMSLLKKIDQSISQLSEPYHQLINTLSTHRPTANHTDTQDLQRANLQLKQQLDTALRTIDEVTAEYTRVFNGNQTEMELENSSKKMLQIFYDAERSIKQQLHP